MPCRRVLSCAFAVVLAFAALARAQTAPATSSPQPPTTAPAANELTWKTDRLVIFKDGHGLVVKSGRGVADASGRAITFDVPDAAVLGCFWAVGDHGQILGMRAEWVETREVRGQTSACVTMVELLRANVGKKVSLELAGRTKDGQPVTLDGRLIEMLDVPGSTGAIASAGATGGGGGATVYSAMLRGGTMSAGSFTPDTIPGGAGTLVRDLVPRGGDFLVIEQPDDRRLVLPAAQVMSVRGGADVVTTLERKQEVFTRAKRLTFEFGGASAGKEVSLRLFYFTPGLRWIPTYRVGGDLKNKADVALQGEVLNDVTDVEHADLDLVVGVPHFRFEHTVSPLTLEWTMRQALSAASMSFGNQLMNSQFALDSRGRQDAGPQQPQQQIAPELLGTGGVTGSGEQDLFVYSLKDFSLKKGARATVPLWQQPADLRHVYTFALNTKRRRAGGELIADAPPSANPTPGSPSPMRIVLNQVWHQLELTNGGKVPWTTGAALMLRDMLPLGQDLLLYTPPTGRVLLPVTVAVDVRGTIDERETGRQANALVVDGHQYAQVTKKGTITLRSFRAEKSMMRVSLSTGGKVTSTSDDGRVTLNDLYGADWDDSSYLRPNNHSDVTWEVEVEPGATKTIEYEVTFFAW